MGRMFRCKGPKVQVYSRSTGEYGKKNTLICYASHFHPPDISIDLLKNGKEIPGSIQTDLAFEMGWSFYLTKYVDFLPQPGEEYTCRVRHLTTTNTYIWDTCKHHFIQLHAADIYSMLLLEFPLSLRGVYYKIITKC
ncbi:hypothetical protein DNTS_011097 [Danionella cerebrum]|uniref:Beta-2-microglobulin n=1 Tax=Danionella cerebrum TaxID=2873325 RepID=A0A553RP21_9TELE|nr:hypothetical protein DNTS_011097 [Danionella translucida]